MKYAIIESGGKQYRAVEGRTLEVDRLPTEAGNKFEVERVLLMGDGDDILVGTPTVSDILVKVTVVDHIKGPKIDRFKYRPKKRIRVRGGHRQQYTRLLVDFIGRPDEERQAEAQDVSAPAQPAQVASEKDNLTLIEGIGPKVADVLGQAGISTFARLAETNAQDVQEILDAAGLKMMDATSWPAQAKLAAEGDMDTLKDMQDKLSGGRKVKTEKKPAATKKSSNKK